MVKFNFRDVAIVNPHVRVRVRAWVSLAYVTNMIPLGAITPGRPEPIAKLDDDELDEPVDARPFPGHDIVNPYLRCGYIGRCGVEHVAVNTSVGLLTAKITPI